MLSMFPLSPAEMRLNASIPELSTEWDGPVQPDGPDATRPMSPGVDIEAIRSREMDRSGEPVAGSSEQGVPKWLDAGCTHSFLIRGASYLKVCPLTSVGLRMKQSPS